MIDKDFIAKLKTPEAMMIYNVITKYNGELRFIGGAVRDAILGIDFSDLDLATNLMPDMVLNILTNESIHVVPTGLKHGTVTAVINEKNIEITTLREDVTCDGRHAQVSFTDSWEIDATRRDFTINALSVDFDENIYDYHNGIEDLKNKVVKFIGNAHSRIEEDYLRILRFYRFVGKYGDCNFDPNTRLQCTTQIQNLKNISIERIYIELDKISQHSSYQEVLLAMHKDKILETALQNLDLNIDLFNKLCLVAKQLKTQPNLIVIIAALIINSGNMDCHILQKRNDIKMLNMLVDFPFASYIDIEKSISRFHYMTGEYFNQFFILLFAVNYNQVYAKLMDDLYHLYLTKQRKIFPLTGRDLLDVGFKTGTEIGELLKELENIWIESNFTLGKLDLIESIYQRKNV
jgi:poly(A) polymerase